MRSHRNYCVNDNQIKVALYTKENRQNVHIQIMVSVLVIQLQTAAALNSLGILCNLCTCII